MAQPKSSDTIQLYGLKWPALADPIAIEHHMVRRGGQWTIKKGKREGEVVGKGLFFHMKRFQELLWPEKVWHKWNELQLEQYLTHRTIGVIGPASSGKTCNAATDCLADYYCWSECTTVICCSTTKERLEERVWGEIKKFHRLARARCSWLAGHLIEGRQRIISDSKAMSTEGRDFRNGLVGVPCKKGESYVGLGDFAGIKNKRVRLLADEMSLLPRVFVDAVSNLDKNPDFKAIGMGNPKDTTDALGIFCEPAAHLGGWDGGIDQTPGTKHWETRRPMGVCIQFPGSDSPNLDGQMDIPIITQEQIDRDVAFYGKDSLWFSMMNEGRMPRGQGSRRVLTRNMCVKHHAMEDPVWRDSNRTLIGFLDAAYKGVGGDRCVYGELEFGDEASDDPVNGLVTAIISHHTPSPRKRPILYLRETAVVPIVSLSKEESEEQIALFVMKRCEESKIAPQNFFFDSGMRTGLVTAFARLWSNLVNPVDCGGVPSSMPVSDQITALCKDYYSKFITELWFSVRLAVEAEQIRGMTDDMVMEFCAREWTIVGKNKTEVEPKEKMKLKTGRSPDLADGFAVGLYGARMRGFTINRMAPKVAPSNPGNAWKKELIKRAAELRQSGSLIYSS